MAERADSICSSMRERARLEGVDDLVGHSVGDVAHAVLRGARAAADVGARLAARSRREQQRHAGADQRTEEEVADAAAVLLDDDVRFVVGRDAAWSLLDGPCSAALLGRGFLARRASGGRDGFLPTRRARRGQLHAVVGRRGRRAMHPPRRSTA